MAQQSSIRAAGWRFQPPRPRPPALIHYTGPPATAAASHDALEPATIAKLTEQVQSLESDDISTFLKIVPSIWQLIKSVPHSIPLLEAIYAKCEEIKQQNDACGGCDFPVRSLHADELFCRLVWWVAYAEQDPHARPAQQQQATARSPLNPANLPAFQEHAAAVGSILRVLSRQCPELLERAQSDRRQLSACLESLGCHGLVNCSSGLIRLNDAVQLEVTRHGERVKAASVRVRDLFDKNSTAADPSNASHQRQMNLRLSEIFERLKHNEAIESVLDDTVTSHHLTSLLRIVRKRVASDRLLIGLFNAFGRAAPEDFAFEQIDPVVAKLIVVFNNAYDKILGMCQMSESDSGCSADTNSDVDYATSSPSHGQESPTGFTRTLDAKLTSLKHSKGGQVRRFKSAAAAGSAGRLLATGRHNSSLSDLRHHTATGGGDYDELIKPAKSIANLARAATSVGDEMRRLGNGCHVKEQMSESPRCGAGSPLCVRPLAKQQQQQSTAAVSPSSSSATGGDDTLRLRLHINHLKSELSNARRQIDLLMQNRHATNNNRLWPEPDYPDATSFYNCSSQEDVASLIGRFGGLFALAAESVLPTLDGLPEFQGSPELQHKTILSVIVLTYRSVLESVQRRRAQIWAVIEEGEERRENEEAAMLDLALYRHMYRRAKNQHGMNNAKEVTSQIWQTLYDFPSLKTCTSFNRFVLECVDVSWDLVAGIDGRFPRLRVEWEAASGCFDGDRHRRSSCSNTSSLAVRAFLWPALVDPATGKCLLKAVVLT